MVQFAAVTLTSKTKLRLFLVTGIVKAQGSGIRRAVTTPSSHTAALSVCLIDGFGPTVEHFDWTIQLRNESERSTAQQNDKFNSN